LVSRTLRAKGVESEGRGMISQETPKRGKVNRFGQGEGEKYEVNVSHQSEKIERKND